MGKSMTMISSPILTNGWSVPEITIPLGERFFDTVVLEGSNIADFLPEVVLVSLLENLFLAIPQASLRGKRRRWPTVSRPYCELRITGALR